MFVNDCENKVMTAHVDLSPEELIQFALQRNEGQLSANGALVAYTGTRTGRSPKDRFIVKEPSTASLIDWGTVNQPFSTEQFTVLWQRANDYLNSREHFIAHLRVGADEENFLPVKVCTELAWHNLFANVLFIRPEGDYANGKPHWTILNACNLATDPIRDGTNSDATIIINFAERKILLLGLHYAGEMKKAMFSILNFLLPQLDVLPMHCAANMGKGGDVALFFGLSGTGKTTLSADPNRYLIGDDEHGWGVEGVYNFEGGCYAKCINLSQENEPLIWNSIRRGAIMENVVLDPNTNLPDYTDTRFTQNTRAAYPRDFIAQRVEANRAGQPSAVLFLTCDLYGVLPPIAQLNNQQAAYYFLSGYTALVGSTEVGQTAGIKPTFSTCFGAPFFPRPANVYAQLLIKRLTESGAKVYLINTGWTGGAYQQGGQRFSIPTTRALVNHVLTGNVNQAIWETMPGFNFKIPTALPEIDSKILNPQATWQDKSNFVLQANELIAQFNENFKRFTVASDIQAAGPHTLHT